MAIDYIYIYIYMSTQINIGEMRVFNPCSWCVASKWKERNKGEKLAPRYLYTLNPVRE